MSVLVSPSPPPSTRPLPTANISLMTPIGPLGLAATMAIAFPYPLSGIAFASFFPVEEWLAPEAKLGRFLRRSPALANLLARLLAPASALR